MRVLATLPLTLIFVLPLAASLLFILPDAVNAAAMRDLLAHPQFPGALRLSLFTGLASTALSLVAALVIIFAAGGRNLAGRAGVFLAVPHLSLAIGLAFFIMPTGVVARLLAPFTGWTSPPQWVTTQDPWGLALVAALVLKETPFLVWAFASLLNRDDLRLQFQGQQAVARSLGHGPSSTFLRIILPQLLPRAAGPLIAVLAYGMTVVDMALVIGPTQPPTLAQLVWTDINDADPAVSARGGAGVIMLALVVALVIAASVLAVSILKQTRQRFYGTAPHLGRGPPRLLTALWPAFLAVYATTMLTMIMQSVSGHWPFPQFLPDVVTFKAWRHLADEPAPMLSSLVLALASAAVAVAACVAWLEWTPPRADRVLAPAAVLVLCLPALLMALGEYRLFLALGVTGTATALLLAHLVPVTAYVFLLLAGPYRSFDPRWQATAQGLQARRLPFLLRIKWPMLKAPLLSAAAVGFAVSVAQFVPAQLAAAGRFATLPMEAVTLSSGGNRPLIATYGLALMALPLAGFMLASRLARPRWSMR